MSIEHGVSFLSVCIEISPIEQDRPDSDSRLQLSTFGRPIKNNWQLTQKSLMRSFSHQMGAMLESCLFIMNSIA